MKKKIFTVLSFFIIGIIFHSCNNENDSIELQQKPFDDIERLKELRANLKEGNSDYLDDYFLNRMKELESLNKGNILKKSSGEAYIKSSEELPADKYIDLYIEPDGEGDYNYKGEVDFDEIINDQTLSLEEKEFLIVSFSALEEVERAINEKSDSSSTSDCDKKKKKALEAILYKYSIKVLQAWTNYFINTEVALERVVSVFKDAFNGSVYRDIEAVESMYEDCIDGKKDSDIIIIPPSDIRFEIFIHPDPYCDISIPTPGRPYDERVFVNGELCIINGNGTVSIVSLDGEELTLYPSYYTVIKMTARGNVVIKEAIGEPEYEY